LHKIKKKTHNIHNINFKRLSCGKDNIVCYFLADLALDLNTLEHQIFSLS